MQHIERNKKPQQQEREYLESIAQSTIDELGRVMNQSSRYGMTVGKAVSLAASMGLLDADKKKQKAKAG